jgi:hypothetical protein
VRLVHRLVLEAFAGPCPPGQEALHGPGGGLDNRWPENLSWGTHSKNVGPDKYRDGTISIGEQNPSAKLTAAIVRECRTRHAAGGVSTHKLAAEFGVGQTTMHEAIRGNTWQHVA